MKKLLMVTLFMLWSNVIAAAEPTGTTTITRVITYNEYGGGDVVFKVANPSSSCYGYWINKNDAGFNANLSFLLASYQAKNKVKVYGHPEQKWGGSGNNWCKLYAIEYPE